AGLVRAPDVQGAGREREPARALARLRGNRSNVGLPRLAARARIRSRAVRANEAGARGEEVEVRAELRGREDGGRRGDHGEGRLSASRAVSSARPRAVRATSDPLTAWTRPSVSASSQAGWRGQSLRQA